MMTNKSRKTSKKCEQAIHNLYIKMAEKVGAQFHY